MRILAGIARALVKLALFALFVWLFVRPFFLMVASFFTGRGPGVIRWTSEFMGMLFRSVAMYFGMSLLLSITRKLQAHRFAQIVAGFATAAALCWFFTRGIGMVILGLAKLMSLTISVLAVLIVGVLILLAVAKYNPGTLLVLALMLKDEDEDDL